MKTRNLILALAAMSLLAWCNFPGSGGDDGYDDEGGVAKLKIRFHVDIQSAEGKAYKKLVDAFNVEHSSDIKVSASFVARTAGDSAYERQLATDMLEGTLPDIITFDAPNCAAYAEAGYLYDFTSSLSSQEEANYITLNKYNGKTYGIPIQESSAGFFYNKNLFNQAGIKE